MNKIELFKNKLPFDYELVSLHDDLHDAIIFSVTGEKKVLTLDELLRSLYLDPIKRLYPEKDFLSARRIGKRRI